MEKSKAESVIKQYQEFFDQQEVGSLNLDEKKDIYRQLGDAYHELKNLEVAIDYYKKLLVVVEEIHGEVSEEVREVVLLIAEDYETLKQSEEAVKYNIRNLKLMKALSKSQEWLDNLDPREYSFSDYCDTLVFYCNIREGFHNEIIEVYKMWDEANKDIISAIGEYGRETFHVEHFKTLIKCLLLADRKQEAYEYCNNIFEKETNDENWYVVGEDLELYAIFPHVYYVLGYKEKCNEVVDKIKKLAKVLDIRDLGGDEDDERYVEEVLEMIGQTFIDIGEHEKAKEFFS